MTNSVYSVLKKLESNNSKNFKLEVLESEKDNVELQMFFSYALDSRIQFYQRKIPSYKPAANPGMNLVTAMVAIFSTLATRKLTGNAAIDFLQGVLSSLSAEDAYVIERIIEKDPKCGVSDSTVNKVWSGHIFEYPVMLCSAYSEKLLNKLHWKNGVYVQLKSDGLRCNIIIRDGAVTAFTRSGKAIETFGVFDSLAKEMNNVMIDGELLMKNEDGTIMDRKTGNGLVNKIVKGKGNAALAKQMYLAAWDLVALDDFEKEVSAVSYSDRFSVLAYKINLVQEYHDCTNVGMIDSFIVHSIEEATKIYESYLEQGQEGIIVKDPTSIWENKRSKQLIKFKAELTADLLCVGYNPGTGRYEGQIGSLICESADGLLKVNVSGRGDEMRGTDPSEFIGKVVEVMYNEKIQERNGSWSLFLPRFVTVRFDKETANTLTEIQ